MVIADFAAAAKAALLAVAREFEGAVLPNSCAFCGVRLALLVLLPAISLWLPSLMMR